MINPVATNATNAMNALHSRRRLLRLAGAGAFAGWAQLPAFGQATPTTTVAGTASIVSGFPAGGMGDFVKRPLAEALRGKYATQVLADSRTGAGGRVAVEFVKRAAPDGLTILQIPSSPMTQYPNTYKKLSYDPLTDFIPVCTTVNYAFSITAGPGLPAEIKTLTDYLKWARDNPKLANYGVPAAGSALHFVGMMLSRAANTPMTMVPYRGGAPLLQDVMGGQVPIGINVIGEVATHVRSGRLRSLAVTTAQRSPFLPDVPTLAELGFSDLVVQEWLGWFVPAKTPMDIVNKLNAQVRAHLQQSETIEALAKNSLQIMTQSPEEFARLLRADITRWAGIVKQTGFTAEE